MKRKSILILSGFLMFGLVSCESTLPPLNEDTSKEEGNNEEEVTNILDEKKLEILKGDLELTGSVNEKYGENGDNISTIDVAFKDDSYHMKLENVDGVNEGRIFKIGGVPTICGINLQNKQVFSPMTDDEGNVASWDDYDNPFKELSLYDFNATSTEGVYELNLGTDAALANALDLVGSLTNYNFQTLESVTLTIEDGQFKTFKATSEVMDSYFGEVTISSELTFEKFGVDVPRLEYPSPYVHKAEHSKLDAALQEVNTANLKVHVEQLSTYEANDWENADKYTFDGYYTNDLVYILADYGYGDVEGSGACVVNNDVYQISATPSEEDPSVMTYERSFYPIKEGDDVLLTSLRSERGNFLIAASELFSVISDKEFICENEFAGTIAYYYSFNLNPFSASSTYVKVTLGDGYKLKTIEFGDEMFDKTTITFEQVGGTITFPFDIQSIPVEEDPFLKFVKTFTYEDDDGLSHTITITSATEATIDGVSVDTITRKSDTRVELVVENKTYSISYYSYSDSYSLSYSDTDGGYGYYDLVVSE